MDNHDHILKHKEVPEIPKSRWYANSLELKKIFSTGVHKNKQKQDRKMIAGAVGKYGYMQRVIADHLVMHEPSLSTSIR